MLKVLFSLALMLSASQLEAATYYLSDGTHGESSATNANSCATAQNILTPKRWFTTSAGQPGALSCLAAGDTLLVRGGTYDDGFEPGYNGITLASGTSWTNKVRIAAYPNGCSPTAPNPCGTAGELVTIAPVTRYTYSGNILSFGLFAVTQYIEFDGINLDANVASAGNLDGEIGISCHNDGSRVMGANYLRFKNAELTGNKGQYIEGAGGSSGGGDHIGVLKYEAAGCPGGHEFQNLYIHGGATNEVGWFANSTPGTYGRYTAYGFYFGTDNTLIENCIIEDTRYLGMQIYNSGVPITGAVIRNNIWRNINRPGYKPGAGPNNVTIIAGHAISNTQIYNNVFYNNGSTSGTGTSSDIYCWFDNTNFQILNNTVYGNVGSGVVLGDSSCVSPVIQNNILHMNAGGNYGNGGATTPTEDHNLRIGTDPGFVAPGSGNFHLATSSSPAVDVGLCVAAVTSDHDGTARPQGLGCDIGAYEYLPSGTLPGIPTNFIPVAGATGVDLFPTLSFTSTSATAYDFYFSAFSGQGPATGTDLFDRANSTDLGASWTPFTIGFTNAQIVGNRVRNTATTGLESVERFSGSFAADQWARIRLSTFGTGEVSAAIFLRCQAGAQPSGYFIGARKGTAAYTTWAYRYDNGAYTFLGGDNATTWGTNDLLEVHVVGNTLTAYRNGNTDLRLTATDPAAAYASGGQCLYLYSTSLGQLEIDNYEGGDIGPVFIGTFATATYMPPSLAPNTVYYWKAAGRNATGTTTGPVISFSTLGSTATPVGIRVRFKAP